MSKPHSERRDGRCPSCGLSPYERGIGDADISRIVAERNRLVEQLESEREHSLIFERDSQRLSDGIRAALDVLHDPTQTWLPAAEILSVTLTGSNPASDPREQVETFEDGSPLIVGPNHLASNQGNRSE